MKKWFAVGLVLCMVSMSMSFGAVNQTTEKKADAIDNELIVSVAFSNQRVVNTMDKIEGFTVKDAFWSDISSEDVSALQADPAKENMGDIFLMTYSKGLYQDFNAAKIGLEKELKAMGYEVKYIEPNYRVKAFETPAVTKQQIPEKQKWHYEMIKLPQAWEMTTGSADVKVAVLDTGIDYTHKNLKQNVDESLGRNFTSDDPSDTMDRLGHGTHVAGTIAASGSLTGVMQKATVFPVKVLADNGYGEGYWVTKGITYAADQGADVINMSLGGGPASQAMENACNYAVDKNSVVVAATGNDGWDQISNPAAYDSVIAVGSVDKNKEKAYLSNYGKGLELMAPGEDVYSTLPGDSEGSNSGTSMASPHVAGVAGLMRAVAPDASVKDIRAILNNTAENIGDAYEYGNGLVDSEAAVKALIK